MIKANRLCKGAVQVLITTQRVFLDLSATKFEIGTPTISSIYYPQDFMERFTSQSFLKNPIDIGNGALLITSLYYLMYEVAAVDI